MRQPFYTGKCAAPPFSRLPLAPRQLAERPRRDLPCTWVSSPFLRYFAWEQCAWLFYDHVSKVRLPHPPASAKVIDLTRKIVLTAMVIFVDVDFGSSKVRRYLYRAGIARALVCAPPPAEHPPPASSSLWPSAPLQSPTPPTPSGPLPSLAPSPTHPHPPPPLA